MQSNPSPNKSQRQYCAAVANPPTSTNNNTVTQRINNSFSKLFRLGNDDVLRHYACILCDTCIVDEKERRILTIQELYQRKDDYCWHNSPYDGVIHDAIKSYYRYNPTTGGDFRRGGDKYNVRDWIDNLALSPRGSLATQRNGRQGFVCCARCKDDLKAKTIPTFSIINGNHVGPVPHCLSSLTVPEVSYLSSTRTYGVVFNYRGGTQKQLNGTMSYLRLGSEKMLRGAMGLMDVDETKIAETVAQIQAHGFDQHIVIIYSGNLTKKQKKNAQKHCQVRTDKLIQAVEWLCKYNRFWSNIDLDKTRQMVSNWKPIVVDKSKEVNDSECHEHANIEERQSFSVYLPDSSAQQSHGGFDTSDELRILVEEAKQNNFSVELQCNLEKRYVNYYQEDWFVKANLLQFPYGIGGFNDYRLEENTKRKGKWGKIPISAFVDHWSRHSSPWFHRPHFVLMLFTVRINQEIFRSARFVTKKPISAKAISEGLTSDDLKSAAWFRKNRQRYQGTRAARSLLDAVDNTSRHLPHTAQAAKSALCKAEALQHTFGMGSLFLTVTPDDDNSILMQAYTGKLIDMNPDWYQPGFNLADMEDGPLKHLATERTQLRLQYPGISAMYYEAVLEIVIRDVIGWDLNTEAPTRQPGLFGTPLAFSCATEEQGRKSLHGHFIIWLKDHHNVIRNIMRQEDDTDKRKVIAQATELHDLLITTNLFSRDHRLLQKAFDHSDCSIKHYWQRPLPEVVPDQQLRYLRHIHGQKVTDLKMASCPECDKSWTMEELTFDYLKRTVSELRNLTAFPDKDGARRLHATIVNKQREYATNPNATPLNPAIVHAAYDQHCSCHVSGCFRCSDKTRKRKRVDDDECRYHLPAPFCQHTTFRPSKKPTAWFDWTGKMSDATMFDIVPRRNQFDLFQNTSCRAISESAVACNTNLQMQTGGPVAGYQMKYTHKNTQKDDTSDYADSQTTMKKILCAELPRLHDDPKREAVRRIICASFAHNKQNVIGAPMAAHLLRYSERFIFSHKFAHLPIDDIIKLLIEGNVNATLRTDREGDYFENQALHYLCRNPALSHLSAFDFYTKYDSVFITKANRGQVLPYVTTPHYAHPSIGKQGTARQGSLLRESPFVPKIQQWALPDTGTFHGDILLPSTPMTPSTEKYARFVLALFHPHTCNADLTVMGTGYPYTEKLRATCRLDARFKSHGAHHRVIFNDRAVAYLNNVQDSRSNCFRENIPEDPLVSRTEKLNCKVDDFDCILEDTDVPDEYDNPDNYDSTLMSQVLGLSSDHNFDLQSNGMPKRMLLSHIRSKGDNRCGKTCWSRPPQLHSTIVRNTPGEPFITTSGISHDRPSANPQDKRRPPKQTLTTLATLLLDKRSAVRRDECFKHNPSPKDPLEKANGTARSIIKWAIAARLDRYQRRAFEVTISAFLLTFFRDADETGAPPTGPHVKLTATYRSEKSRLIRLAAFTGDNDQLILLLHGPGGSGKSTVLTLLLLYAREYCEALNHPFTNRTIVVSAFSGVAATLIKGDTTHRCCGLNRRKLDQDDQDDWRDTRMLIADEISFATDFNFKKLDQNLRYLGDNQFRNYGGFHIVFAGDFRQLEPIGNPIYECDCPEFTDFVNCYIELKGMHRFADDPEWGERLAEFRDGRPSEETIRCINESRVVQDPSQIPPGIQVATYYNRNRDAINTATFETFCEGSDPQDNTSIMILMDELRMPDDTKTMRPLTDPIVRATFWEQCGENDCDKTHGRVDPVLRLYPGCPVMLTENSCVAAGMANGTRALCRKVVLKPGETPTPVLVATGPPHLETTLLINAVYASQVSEIRLEHTDPDIRPQQFSVASTSHTFTVWFPTLFDTSRSTMSGRQFPFVRNTCTTGHKLQGATMENILVNDMRYKKNWHYVVLSRVRTMAGLYLREPLSYDLSKYAMPAAYTDMIETFRRTCLAEPLPDEVYDRYMKL